MNVPITKTRIRERIFTYQIDDRYFVLVNLWNRTELNIRYNSFFHNRECERERGRDREERVIIIPKI